MEVRLDYGREGMTVRLPEGLRVTVVERPAVEPLPFPKRAVADAVASPLRARPLAETARGRRDATVVIPDKTRPMPSAVVLPPLLAALEAAGIARRRIELLVATGLHRTNTPSELAEMMGADILARYRVRNHLAASADAHVHLGRTRRGTEIWIDRGFVAADLKVVTGLVEPHLLAGYSGGRKGVAPGLAGVQSMRSLHGPAMLEGHVGPGILQGNPFHEDILEIARRAGVDFTVDVTLDRGRRLTGVFAGDMDEAHAAACRAVEREARVDLPAPAEIVITSAGGHPLDGTFYQSIKGLAGALNVVRRGGTIILAAALSEGVGSDDFQRLLRETRDNDDFMGRVTAPGFFAVDQWMVQHLCQVLRKAAVVVVTDGLAPGGVRGLLVRPAASVEEALAEALRRHGSEAQVAVLPQGPYVLATVRGRMLSLGRAWMDEVG